MDHKVFTIRDSKGEMYHPPFYKKTTAEAERDFRTLVNDEKSMVSQYPEDFDLYLIGTWDSQTGKLDPFDTPAHLIKAIDCKKSH